MVKLDLAKARQALGADHELLVRAHPMQAMPAVPDIARDVTTYPDIADLLLVTDVLVTDYSSVMFDFAVTGRPDRLLRVRPATLPPGAASTSTCPRSRPARCCRRRPR